MRKYLNNNLIATVSRNEDNEKNDRQIVTQELFVEERLKITDLLSRDDIIKGNDNYRLGILKQYGSKYAIISNTYFNKRYIDCAKADNDSVVLFNIERAEVIVSEQDKIHIATNVYVVQYVLGGMTINEKAGTEQSTIDYDFPVKILRKYERKNCVLLYVEGNSIETKVLKPEMDVNKIDFSLSCNGNDELDVERIRMYLDDAMKSKGVVYASDLPAILQNASISNYKRYASSIEDFINKYLSIYFCLRKNVIIDGKLHPGVVYRIKECEHMITEERIKFNEFTDTMAIFEGGSIKYGVINMCSRYRGFINVEYVNKNVIKDQLLDSSKSVLFNLSKVFLDPIETRIKTNENIYIVRYAVKGTSINNKTGLEHPAIDFHYPIQILKTLPRKSCVQISVQNESILIKYYEENKSKISLELVLENIKCKFEKLLRKNKFIKASLFPNIARTSGMPDYRLYADSVENFILKYFQEYKLTKNVVINGTKYSGIITRIDENIQNKADYFVKEQLQENQLSEFELDTLSHLFSEEKYYNFLSSDILKKTKFCELPPEYMEMTLTCAARLMHPEENATIKLNHFQKELIDTLTSHDFIKKWKKGSNFSMDILSGCAETSISSFSIPTDIGLVAKLLNEIGYINTRNDNYSGLTKRFSACANSVLPYLYFVRMCVQQSQTSVYRCLSEYCQIVKDINKSPSRVRIETNRKMYSFTELLKAAYCHILKDMELPHVVRTNIVSVYVDNCEMDGLENIISIIDPTLSSVEWKLVNLYNRHDICTEQDIVELLNEGISLQLLQKCIAMVWEKYVKSQDLPLCFLRLLSWICVNDNYSSLDEILRVHYLTKFTKLQKQIQLLNSYCVLRDSVYSDVTLYAVFSYIANITFQDIHDSKISERVYSDLSEWSVFSKEVYNNIIAKFENITLSNELEFIKLFKIFRLDVHNQLKLQKIYADWYYKCCVMSEHSNEEFMNILDDLFSKSAYEAFLAIYTKMGNDVFTSESVEFRVEQYITALSELQRYSEAIAYLQQNDTISKKTRDRLLIKVITDNFRNNGLFPKAFAFFSGSFSCNDAIKLLIDNIQPNQYYIITDLIALYSSNNEYVKALYLYHIYQSKAESGFTRLYSKFRSCVKAVNGKFNNHYDVIEFAFSVLYYDELIEFLEWTRQIPIPSFKGNSTYHTFSYFYDIIIASPMDVNSWTLFLSHLIKRVDINSWLVVVCETVLKKKLNYLGVANSSIAIRNVMSTTDASELPFNFLPYVYTYIMDNSDIGMCRELGAFLKDERISNRLVQRDSWYVNCEKVSDEFRAFCVESYSETGEMAYYDLLVVLGINLEMSDLVTLSQTSGDKKYLFAQICQNYLTGQKSSETIELLNICEWKNLTSHDAKVLELLKLLYGDDEELLLLEDKMFKNEEDVRRFKYDCAKILSSYPDKKELFSFDNSCINTKYKLIVYTHVFAAIYDKDIYDKYVLDYSDIRGDEQLYSVYITFLMKAYYAQLEWNTGHDYIYKKWRYLKLYLAGVLLYGYNFDDSLIVDTMIVQGYYDNLFSNSYEPFKSNVSRFLNFLALETAEKKHFLFSLMVGQLGNFLQQNAVALKNLSDEDKQISRNLIKQIDYREVNLSFYQLYETDFEHRKFDEAESVAKALSLYACDTVDALKKSIDFQEAIELFRITALEEKPSTVVNKVIRIEEIVLKKHAFLLIPIVCSRQFVFQIYGSLRRLIIQNNKRILPIYCEKMAEYLGAGNDNSAFNVSMYLLALKACMEKKPEIAYEIINKCDIRQGIPAQWEREADSIYKYAIGKEKNFSPDRTIKDNSQEERSKEVKFTFIEKLQKRFVVDNRRLSAEEATEIYEKYIDISVPIWDRLKAGIILLSNYPKMDKDKQKKYSLPTKNELALSIGLDATTPEINLSVDERLLILTELFNGRGLYNSQRDGKLLKRLSDCFGQIIGRSLSLKDWIRYSESISDFFDENQVLLDFKELQERILKPCTELMKPEISNEIRYSRLMEYLQLFKGLESVYSRNVFVAIQRECRRIEDGVRLTINIVNKDYRVTDGYVYFQVENIGRCAVSLKKSEFSIYLKQEGHPEAKIILNNIHDLQSGFITGGRARLMLDTTDCETNIYLYIVRHFSDDVQEILCDTTKKMTIEESTKKLNVSKGNRYTVESAIMDSNMLFGRNDLKEILEDVIPTGITVIYGPSRIGKTSLMNWIRNDFARDCANVMTILFGGEGGLGKENDYCRNFVNHKMAIPYSDDEEMTEYLLISTVVHSLTSMPCRFREPYKKNISENMSQKIVQILNNNSLSVSNRYMEMNNILKEEEIELWILLDEFQQVVEQWKPRISCEFVQVCKMLSYEGRTSRIKLIICGSDDLLRHMVLEDNSVWRQIFPPNSRIPVEPIREQPFYEMIQNDKGINGTNIIYSDSAKKALYTYTDGVALYGKEICNAIIEDIKTYPDKYTNRNILYVSDVAEATQKLLNRQASELDTKVKEGISEIYDAVTKNLRADTDMQYLCYMARWLYTNSDQDGFPEMVFTKSGVLRDEKELHDSLSIAVARGIIKKRGSALDDNVIYVFRTIFYYYAFLGNASNKLNERKIFIEETSEEHSLEEQPRVLAIIDQFGELSADDKVTVLSSLYHHKKFASNDREEFRRSIGDQHYGDTVHGDKIGKQNNMQVNVQSITNTLNGILAAKQGTQELLEGIQSLPRLGNYLPQIQDNDDKPQLSKERISRAMENYVADMEESLKASYKQLKISDEEVKYHNILKITDIAFDDFMERYNLPEFFLSSLKFAYQLDQLFMKGAVGENTENIDFSPVTIMYCKLVESLLKEYHIDVYSRCLANVQTNMSKPEDRLQKYNWGEIKNLPIQQQQRLTIGSFVFPLNRSWAISNIVRVTHQKPNDWEAHKDMITTVKDIRNLSAHGNKDHRISLEQKETITKFLFDKHGFIRLIELALD